MMLDLAEDNFADLNIILQETISYLDSVDRQQMLDIISSKYMVQREGLSGGDLKKEINGKCYHLWIHPEASPRPSLPIEKMVDDWLNNSIKTKVAQIAYLSQSNFIKKFEKEESEIIEEILEEPQFGGDMLDGNSFDLPEVVRHILIDFDKDIRSNPFSFNEWYAKTISIPLQVARRYPHKERTVRAILPVVLNQVEEERNNILYRLKANECWDLAGAIELVVSADRNKFFVIMGGIIVLLTLLLITGK